jgi:hypothetical protein
MTRTLAEARGYASIPDPIRRRLSDEQMGRVWERAQETVESDRYNVSWGDASTFSEGGTIDSPRMTIRTAHERALQDMGLWMDVRDPAIEESDSQAEQTRESLEEELSEGRPEVTVGDVETDPVREAVENAVPGTGNDAPGIEPTSSTGGGGMGVGTVVAVVVGLLVGAGALLGGGD